MPSCGCSAVSVGAAGSRRGTHLTALLRLDGEAVSELAVVGDTPSDVESGLRAGAGLVAGVLSGRATRDELERAGAPLVLDSVADLPARLAAGAAS